MVVLTVRLIAQSLGGSECRCCGRCLLLLECYASAAAGGARGGWVRSFLRCAALFYVAARLPVEGWCGGGVARERRDVSDAGVKHTDARREIRFREELGHEHGEARSNHHIIRPTHGVNWEVMRMR